MNNSQYCRNNKRRRADMKIRLFHPKLVAIAMACICSAIVPSRIQAQNTCYVSLDGNDTTGDSWVTAFTTISNGLAHAGGTTNTVLVSTGTYYISAPVLVDKALTLRGLAGQSQTIIDGGGNIRCLHLNHPDAVVEGFTLTNGNAQSTSFNDSGGGARMSAGLLRNSLITGNTANQFGGGVCFDQTASNATLEDCSIINNHATNQSSLHCYAGGIYLQGTSSTVRGCTIVGNTSYKRGNGLLVTRGRNLTIEDCIISNNSGVLDKSGIMIDAQWPPTDNITISDSRIINNNVGIEMRYGKVNTTIRNCEIARNAAAGVLFVTHASLPAAYGQMYNCLITSNNGGGVSLGANVTNNIITSCTIADNPVYGVNVEASAGRVNTLTNTIIFNNATDVRVTGDPGATNYFWYCCYGSGAALPEQQGNISQNPDFVGIGNYRLQSDSPCINAGTNQDWMTGSLDLDARVRIDRYFKRVDIGCYEYLLEGLMVTIK